MRANNPKNSSARSSIPMPMMQGRATMKSSDDDARSGDDDARTADAEPNTDAYNEPKTSEEEPKYHEARLATTT